MQKYEQLLLQTHDHKRCFQFGENSDLVPPINKLAPVVTSVMSWDPQKPRCNYESSEELLAQETPHKRPESGFTNTDKMWPVKNQTSSPNLNSSKTHIHSILFPLSLSSFPAAFAKVDELATINGIILNISHVAAPRLVKENHCVMALLCTFIQ